MSKRIAMLAAAFVAVVGLSTSAHALTMKECSAKYQDAKAKGTLNGMKWNDFRAKNCGAAAEETDDPSVSEAVSEEPALSLIHI